VLSFFSNQKLKPNKKTTTKELHTPNIHYTAFVNVFFFSFVKSMRPEDVQHKIGNFIFLNLMLMHIIYLLYLHSSGCLAGCIWPQTITQTVFYTYGNMLWRGERYAIHTLFIITVYHYLHCMYITQYK
jgi:hypothetical protein